MGTSLQEAMTNILRRQQIQEAEEERELQANNLKLQPARRYNRVREAGVSDSESASDREANQQSRGRDTSKYGQGLNSTVTKPSMSFLFLQ